MKYLGVFLTFIILINFSFGLMNVGESEIKEGVKIEIPIFPFNNNTGSSNLSEFAEIWITDEGYMNNIPDLFPTLNQSYLRLDGGNTTEDSNYGFGGVGSDEVRARFYGLGIAGNIINIGTTVWDFIAEGDISANSVHTDALTSISTSDRLDMSGYIWELVDETGFEAVLVNSYIFGHALDESMKMITMGETLTDAISIIGASLNVTENLIVHGSVNVTGKTNLSNTYIKDNEYLHLGDDVDATIGWDGSQMSINSSSINHTGSFVCQEINQSGLGEKSLTITSTDHDYVNLVLMRTGNAYPDYRLRNSGNSFYIQKSTNDGASWGTLFNIGPTGIFTAYNNFNIGIGGAGVDYQLFFNGQDNDATIKFHEDENVLNITNTNFEVYGNITANQFYAEAFYHNHTPTELNFATDGVYYNLTFSNVTLNGFSNYSDKELTCDIKGLYAVNYMASGDGQNNHDYYTTMGINGIPQLNLESHKKMSAGGDILTMGGTGFVRLEKGENITLMTADIGATGTGNYYSMNLNLVRIGN